MSRFEIIPASSSYNNALCQLSKVPMQGNISIAMERSPDYFTGTGVQNEQIRLFICKDQQEVAGIFSVGKRKVFLNGEKEEVPYLSDMRILPRFQRSRLLLQMGQFFHDEQLILPGKFGQSIVFSDNAVMKNLIEKKKIPLLKRLRLPYYQFYGSYLTYTISLKKRIRLPQFSTHIRRASVSDIPEMQAFFEREASNKDLYPVYKFDQLGKAYYQDIEIEDYFLAFKGGQLVGIVGVWDQSKFKQTRIVDYTPALKHLRPIVNLISRPLTGFTLPPAGSLLNSFFLHTLIVQDNQAQIFDELIKFIYREYAKQTYDYFLCGLFANDPLVKVLDGFKGKRIVYGDHYLITSDAEPVQMKFKENFYLEAARI